MVPCAALVAQVSNDNILYGFGFTLSQFLLLFCALGFGGQMQQNYLRHNCEETEQRKTREETHTCRRLPVPARPTN